MEIRSIAAVAAAPRLGRVLDPEPGPPGKSQEPSVSAPLAGSKVGSVEASQDVPAAPPEARYVRDEETKRLVLSVIDPGTGDVIAQLPTKAALRAQAYASEVAARSAPRPTVARLA